MRAACAVLLIVVAGLAGCGKGDRKTCDQACRNYVTLNFWNKWDPEIEKEPPEARPALRRQKLGELDDILMRGMHKCVQDCVAANNDSQYKCMAKATTWKAANSCADTQEQADY